MYNASLDSKRFEIEFCGNTNRNYSDNGQQDSSYSNIGSFLSNSQLNDEAHIKWNQVAKGLRKLVFIVNHIFEETF